MPQPQALPIASKDEEPVASLPGETAPVTMEFIPASERAPLEVGRAIAMIENAFCIPGVGTGDPAEGVAAGDGRRSEPQASHQAARKHFRPGRDREKARVRTMAFAEAAGRS
jgi:hypothetical protein